MQNTIRYAVFLLIVTGTLFAGCASAPTEQVQDETNVQTETEESTEDTNHESSEGQITVDPVVVTPTPTDTNVQSSVYKDGTYTASGAYPSPAGPESINVTLTIKNDLVSSVSIQSNATNETSKNFQALFASGISSNVVGKSLDQIGNYSSINGSSLTPDGFDGALASIKAEAAL